MRSDLSNALRQLVRAPGFSLLVVLCLALGIGANVATFAAVDALLYRPPAGVREPGAVRRLQVETPPTPGQQVFFTLGYSNADVDALRARRELFAAVAAFAAGQAFVEAGGFAEKTDAAVVGPEYFAALGVRPSRGRLIAGAEADVASDAPVAVEGMLRTALAPYRLAATAFTAFGALALLLAAVGLYGAVAYAVTQRTHKFGIRMALGARAGDVRRLVLGQGARTALAGGVLGAAAAVAVGRALRARLYGVDPLDPVSLLAVGAVLAIVTVAAAWGPARRAARVDPAEALRTE